MRIFILILAFCTTSIFCFAQSNPVIIPSGSIVNSNPITSKLAQPNTFQLVVPTAKFFDLYNEIITDSMLFVITNQRQTNINTVINLKRGMKIVILSHEKVHNGFRVPKIEVEK